MADSAIETDDLVGELPAGDIEDQERETPVETPEGEDDEELLISFDGEEGAPAQGEQDSSVIRRLREENRKKDAELRALRAAQPSQPEVIEVGEKPTLAGSEYDEEAYEAAILAWNERKAKKAQAEAEAQRTLAAQQEAWNRELAEVETQKSQLKVKDYDQAAEVVQSTFDVQQQAMIVRASVNKARMVYALGKSPAKAAELAKITDPVKFIAEVARMEGKVTVQRKSAPPPEQIVRGSAPLSQASDKHLERLEKEAERTGDRTKVVQYKRELKAKAAR